MSIQLIVNGRTYAVDDRHASTPLLWVLRDVLGVHGLKFGCGAGWCAACTVLLDGKAVKACRTPLSQIGDQAVATVEGVSGPIIGAVRDAWYRGNVVQCGYCQPGQTLAAMALLTANPEADDAAIDRAMSGNLCRCGTYPRIRAAIHEAATTLRNGGIVPLLPVSVDRPILTDLSVAEDSISAYIRIQSDGSIIVRCSQVEIGQGVHTSLATIVAEELDADLASIQITDVANNTALYGNPVFGNLLQVVGDSTSTRAFWMRYRQVAAMARARLVATAAFRWGVPSGEITVESGVLHHPSGKQATFGELAEAAQRIAPPANVQPKSTDQYRLIGREDILRVDSPTKLLGMARYTIDMTWPDMLTVTVLHPPYFGATIRSIDDTKARASAGVIAVVPISRGVAVVAETFYDAVMGLQALSVEWDTSHAELRGSDALLAEHHRLLQSGEGLAVARNDGDVEAAFASAAHVVEALYELPYLAHAPMEPDNAACRMREDGVLEVWAASQSPDYARPAAAQAANLPLERVEVHITLGGGGFGLRGSGESAPVVEVVEIAKALGWQHPVKLQWSRQEEFKNFRGRPMSVHRARAALDAQGQILAYEQRMVVQSVIEKMPVVRDVLIHNGVDEKSVQGASDQPYTIPNLRVELVNMATGVPVGTWRATGSTHNEFVRETLLDEAASTSGQDPVALRRQLLATSPRMLAALELAAGRAGWDTPPPQGSARGVAVSNGFGSHSAQIIQVSQDTRGRIRVDRIVCAVDCGIAVNPDLVRAQMEGGILFGLSAAIWGKLTLRDGEVEQQMFDTYPLVRMRTTPLIEVYVIPSTESPGGIGEVGVSPVAPALVNAIAALTGTRIRILPVTKTVKMPA